MFYCADKLRSSSGPQQVEAASRATQSAGATAGSGERGDGRRSAARAAGDASGMDRAPRAAAATDDMAHAAGSVTVLRERIEGVRRRSGALPSPLAGEGHTND